MSKFNLENGDVLLCQSLKRIHVFAYMAKKLCSGLSMARQLQRALLSLP